jgi:hypothetical protein
MNGPPLPPPPRPGPNAVGHVRAWENGGDTGEHLRQLGLQVVPARGLGFWSHARGPGGRGGATPAAVLGSTKYQL